MKFSKFGERFINNTGIKDLMDDLGKYAGRKNSCMLGGGNPALIPEITKIWEKRMNEILENGDQFHRMLGLYGSSKGSISLFDAMAEMLNKEYGWPISAKNIAVVNGSQTSCFLLFNMLSGEFKNGKRGKLLVPLMPEYIGYADQCIEPDSFVSFRPEIDEYQKNMFKYKVDFNRINMDNVNGIVASRPTNPTGNVLTDNEILKLSQLATENDLPLILDCAYGLPFPGIIFEDIKPIWNENIVLIMSLSKVGLPSTRTGIVIANEEIIEALSAMSAVSSLAPSGIGQEIITPMLQDGSILNISKKIIKPFYQKKSEETISYIHQVFKNKVDYSIHKNEGAFFLWIWFKDLKCSSIELYNRLKEKGVIIVPGEYFFFGLPKEDDLWEHRRQCIRINYSEDFEQVKRGLDIIIEELLKVNGR